VAFVEILCEFFCGVAGYYGIPSRGLRFSVFRALIMKIGSLQKDNY